VRFYLALCVGLLIWGTGLAQDPWSVVSIELPVEDLVIVVHPTMEARTYVNFGPVIDDPFDVQVGHSARDHWGFCFFTEAMTDAEEVMVLPLHDVTTLNLSNNIIALNADGVINLSDISIFAQGLTGG